MEKPKQIIEKIIIEIREPSLISLIKLRAKRDGFEHSLSFWIKMFLVKKLKINERLFFNEYQLFRKRLLRKRDSLESYNFMRQQSMKGKK